MRVLGLGWVMICLGRSIIPLVRNHKDVDPSNPWENEVCQTATIRLENGPETSNKPYVD